MPFFFTITNSFYIFGKPCGSGGLHEVGIKCLRNDIEVIRLFRAWQLCAGNFAHWHAGAHTLAQSGQVLRSIPVTLCPALFPLSTVPRGLPFLIAEGKTLVGRVLSFLSTRLPRSLPCSLSSYTALLDAGRCRGSFLASLCTCPSQPEPRLSWVISLCHH